MNRLSSTWGLAVAATAAVTMSVAQPLAGEQLEKTKNVSGTTVQPSRVLSVKFGFAR